MDIHRLLFHSQAFKYCTPRKIHPHSIRLFPISSHDLMENSSILYVEVLIRVVIYFEKTFEHFLPAE